MTEESPQKTGAFLLRQKSGWPVQMFVVYNYLDVYLDCDIYH